MQRPWGKDELGPWEQDKESSVRNLQGQPAGVGCVPAEDRVEEVT